METLANGLNAEITTTAPCCITAHIVVPADTVKKTYSNILAQYSQKVVRPGFRAGHTPRQLILSLYGKAIEEETKERLINQSLQQVVTDKKLRIAGEFALDGGKAPAYQAGQPYDFTVKTEVFEDFELPQYKGLDIQKEVKPVEDKQVDEAADTFLRTHGNYAVVERAAEAGDMLKVDYTSDADDELKAVKEAAYLLNANNSWQMLREPESLPGVTAALVGLKANESKDVAIEFPADFRIDALKGKKLNYHFTVREVHGFTPAELTPELFKQYGCEDLAGMKALLRKRMEDQNERSAVFKMFDQIREQLAASLNFPLPPTLVKNTCDHELEHAMEHLAKDGGATEEQRSAKEAEIKAQVEKDLRLDLALERIAEAEKLQVPPEAFYQYCYSMAQQSGMSPDEFMKKVSGNSQLINNVFGTLLRQKALDFIRENVKGADAKPAEDAKPA
ncbi:MAG: trigger factor, partial [Victivallales bacterium]|nr:trigger factor [Victivallales bacterium]